MNTISPGTTLLKRTDIIGLAFLLVALAIIYYPVCYANYLYTDEATQIWFAGQGVNLTSIPQGRWITYRLFTWLFSSIQTTHAVKYARLFSLAGWIICLPVWYFIIKDVVAKNKLPALLVSVALTYLICMPSFAVYIGWAACLEMFIACTAGLVSGYTLYYNLYTGKSRTVFIAAIIFSILFGLLSLFTYQNGFGCFFIPFFIQFIAVKKWTKTILAGITAALLTCFLYWVLFTYSLHATGMEASSRSSFAASPVKKILYLVWGPLATAFHFTWLFNENSLAGKIVYVFLMVCWGILVVGKRLLIPLRNKLFYFGGLIVFFVLAYLPSLLVAENYASNRTLFALNMIVLLMVAATVFAVLKKYNHQTIFAAIVILFFAVNGWYNFNRQFTGPLTKEYSTFKKMVTQLYTNKIHTIWFIRPPEDAFVKKYGITASWDEFGVPSTAKPWVAEPLFKQLVYEQTGNRQTAEKLMVKTWESYDAFAASGELVTAGVLFIDGGALIQNQ